MAKINKVNQAAAPQKVLHELFDYNVLTGMWVNKIRRGRRARVGQATGSLKKDGYIRIMINYNEYLAHRLAWTYVYGDYPNGEQPYIDHINGNRSDNRIANLKVASTAENGRNRKINSDNTSGITGVFRVWVNGGTKTNPKIYWYWRATWRDENGKGQWEDFPIHKLGEDGAKEAAINFRVEQIRLLGLNFEIVYSDRHGT